MDVLAGELGVSPQTVYAAIGRWCWENISMMVSLRTLWGPPPNTVSILTVVTEQAQGNQIKINQTNNKEINAMELNEAKGHFAKLATLTESLYQKYVDRNKKYAPDFNIFHLGTNKKLKDIEHIHSDFIAELLNPNGSHGQGLLFLKHFLNTCRNLKSFSGHEHFPELSKIENSSWHIEREYPISSGKIDLVMRSIDAKVLIAIEIKIVNKDQKDQIKRYSSFLERQDSYNKTALLYLTIDGTESKTAGDHPYYCISFKKNIYDWISECKKRIDCPKVTVILDHYLEILKSLGDETMEKQSQYYQKEIINYLTRQENIKFGWELGELFDNNLIKDKVRENFWSKVVEKLQEKERASNNINWDIKKETIENSNGEKQVIFRPEQQASFHLEPTIEEEYSKSKKDYQIFYGIEWSNELPHEPTFREVLEFREQLKQDKFYIEKYESNLWGLASKYTELWTYSKEFALRVTEEGMDFIDEFVKEIWDFIEKYNKSLKDINSSLYKADNQGKIIP